MSVLNNRTIRSESGYGSGAIRVLELQRAGRQPMSAEEFLRGARLAEGAQLQ